MALRLTAQPELAHNVFACLRPEHQASLSVLEAVSGSVRAICVRHHWVAIATFRSQPAFHGSPTGHHIVIDVAPTQIVAQTGTRAHGDLHLQRRLDR